MENPIVEFDANKFDDDSAIVIANTSLLAEVEKSRAVQEVQAALIMAKKFPRDINASFTKIMQSCQRISLAEQGLYKYPRGGEVVTGSSIRLAEVMAQNYGNLDFGVRELERKAGSSVDMENNVRSTKVFEVPHEIYTKKGTKKLMDPRDIYERVANDGARRMRACILAIIPADINEAAQNMCKKTVAKGGGEPIEDRVRKMIMAFKEFGITQEKIEKRLGHSFNSVTGEQLADLQGIYITLRDKHAKRSDFFEFPEDEAQNTISNKASEIIERFKAKGNASEEAKKQ
jgi:hypothetical protein